ncbi:MAG: formyltransferase family protein [Eubacteriales bacterium]|nr:formyltransferase family protein [Eubacteriales bacterium]
MKIVYFGSDVFLPCFEYFVSNHQVLALYTYHNDEDYMTEEGIVRMAEENRIPVHYESITEDRIRALFLEEGCGLLYSAEYDRRIPVPTDLPVFRGLNVHSSLLPDGRSYYPIEAAMDRKMPYTGVTIHVMAPELDSGDILDQRTLEITEDTDSVDVYLELASLTRSMTESIMSDFETAWNNARPQTEKKPYWNRPSPDRLTLTHALSREEAGQMFRCYNSLTQVELNGVLHYVQALGTGTAPLPWREWALRKNQWLYSLRDGHARLIVYEKVGEDRK